MPYFCFILNTCQYNISKFLTAPKNCSFSHFNLHIKKAHVFSHVLFLSVSYSILRFFLLPAIDFFFSLLCAYSFLYRGLTATDFFLFLSLLLLGVPVSFSTSQHLIPFSYICPPSSRNAKFLTTINQIRIFQLICLHNLCHTTVISIIFSANVTQRLSFRYNMCPH